MDKELKGFVDGFKKAQEDYNKLVASANDQSVTAEERDKRKAAAEDQTGGNQDRGKHHPHVRGKCSDDQLDTSQRSAQRDDILKDIRTAIQRQGEDRRLHPGD